MLVFDLDYVCVCSIVLDGVSRHVHMLTLICLKLLNNSSTAKVPFPEEEQWRQNRVHRARCLSQLNQAPPSWSISHILLIRRVRV